MENFNEFRSKINNFYELINVTHISVINIKNLKLNYTRYQNLPQNCTEWTKCSFYIFDGLIFKRGRKSPFYEDNRPTLRTTYLCYILKFWSYVFWIFPRYFFEFINWEHLVNDKPTHSCNKHIANNSKNENKILVVKTWTIRSWNILTFSACRRHQWSQSRSIN